MDSPAMPSMLWALATWQATQERLFATPNLPHRNIQQPEFRGDTTEHGFRLLVLLL